MFNYGKKKQKLKMKRQEDYARVYDLHKQAVFLLYINEAYMEEYQGRNSVKLEGMVAKGIGKAGDSFMLYDCKGRFKAEVTMEEMYCGLDLVEQLEGGDKRIALYPVEQNVTYLAGDILCKLEESNTLAAVAKQ